jgi:hypothetical protein
MSKKEEVVVEGLFFQDSSYLSERKPSENL